MHVFQKYYICLLALLVSCQQQDKPISESQVKLFSIIPAHHSGLDFSNEMIETAEFNYYQYLYTYIGGGVAAGDINKDGLIDLYFTSTTAKDKLYLNKGNLRFEDITQQAGILQIEGYNTGVTMADINGDGYLDIYVSRGGPEPKNQQFNNLLYINNGDLTFSEKAISHGLADGNRSIQATFFDYDKDNDLDVYISNTPNVTGQSEVVNLKKLTKDTSVLLLKGSDRFYENNGNDVFKDVSTQVGLIYDIGFGLNPQVIDLNEDGWLDIYVCNDFNYPDLVYINNRDKTFTEARDKVFKHLSFNSMGSEVADINNDGLLDLMTLDMNPEDYIRSKTTMGMTSVKRFEAMTQNGYHYQYMHNMLQLNNGNGTFREIANLAGVANTDWSWSVLSADFNLDGWNDLYVTNGVYRDVLHQDKNRAIRSILKKNGRKPSPADLLEFTQMLPQQKLRNYFFQNTKQLDFEDVSTDWASEAATFSNGATYVDLDNDGDLEVVVNNINMPVTLLKNNAIEKGYGNFLKIQLEGLKGNRNAVGARLELFFEDGTSKVRQHLPTRGYLSAVSNWIHFGFTNTLPKKLEITWPDGNFQKVENIEINQSLLVAYQNNKDQKQTTLVKPFYLEKEAIHQHVDPYFNDYSLQILLPHKLSQTGPSITQADVNGDGWTDVFIGGGFQQSGQLLLGNSNGEWINDNQDVFIKDAIFEDQGVLFFDADKDGDQDLYVVSGSYEFYINPRAQQDRLYLNNGKGKFEKTTDNIPFLKSAGSVVIAADYDEDGDRDLFIGGRVVPSKYPYPPKSYLLKNDNGFFSDVTMDTAEELSQIGMVTDATWSDMNGDGAVDLVLTGEWLGIEVFLNENGRFIRSNAYPSLAEKKGWWNKLLITDIDEDGDQDIIAGNLGLNTKFKASPEKPFHIYTADFDFNGSEDIVLAKNYNGEEVPIRGKTCMTQQLPYLAKRVTTFEDFANSNIEQLIGPNLSKSLQYEATEFRSGIFINEGANQFSFQAFEPNAQTHPINSILYSDFDGDTQMDLLLAGNNYQTEVETTRQDAGIGTFLKGNGKGRFSFIPNQQTGLFLDGDVRDLKYIAVNGKRLIWVINNNQAHQLYISDAISSPGIQ